MDLAACRQGNREWQCPRESRAEQLVDCSTDSKEWTDQEGTNMYKQHHYAWQSLGSSFKQSEAIQQQLTFLVRDGIFTASGLPVTCCCWNCGRIVSFLLLLLMKPPCHESCQITENEALIESSFRPKCCQRVQELARNRSGAKPKS